MKSSMRLFLPALIGLLYLTAPASAAPGSDDMTVSASISAAFAVSVTEQLDDFNSGDPLAVAVGGTYTDTGTFTLVTNTRVDVKIDASHGDLVHQSGFGNTESNTLAVKFKFQRESETPSAWFGETQGEDPQFLTDSAVPAGSYGYTITGVITGDVTATTPRGSYQSTLTITAIENNGL